MNYFYNRLNINQIFASYKQAITEIWRIPCFPCGSKPTTSQHNSLCNQCFADLPWHTTTCCPQCALPTTFGEKCGICIQHPPAFDRTFAAFRYAYPLERLVQQFKYHQQLDLGPLVTGCATTFSIGFKENKPDLILAMPMHYRRLQQRGFNHALEIARNLEKNGIFRCS